MEGQEEAKVQETPAEEPAAETGAAAAEGTEQERVFREILKCSRKEVFYTRLAALFTGALFLAVAVALWIVIPQVTATLEGANTLLANANRTLEDIDAMSASLTETSDGLNALIGDNAKTLTDSVQKLSSIDFDGINSAVHDLETAVGPLAEAVNKLSSFSLFR